MKKVTIEDHRFAVISLARYRARKVIEAQIKAQGKRPISYTPGQLRALAQAEFELNRISLIAAAEKTVATSPLFKRWRLPPEVFEKIPETEHSPNALAIIKGQFSND